MLARATKAASPSSATLRPVEPAALALIAQLRSAQRDQIRPAARRALGALFIAAIFGLAHVARVGTPTARLIVAVALVALPLGLLVQAIVGHVRRRNLKRAIVEAIGPTNPDLAQAAIRAVGLVERTEKDATAGSPILARHHLTRILSRVSVDDVAAHAMITAHRWAITGVCLAALALGAVVLEPMRVIEGLDVLAARNGQAPLRFDYVDVEDMIAKPPAYLHERPRAILPFDTASLPRGTVITVRGRPTQLDRNLVLTDGATEVPFAFDGAGGVVARWELAESVDLRVAAKFGSVRIEQDDVQHVTSIPDAAPRVVVEGAPKTVRMLEEPEVLISYEASDDHGLRQVDLVYRSGGRETRRVLSRPQGDPKTDRGSHRIVFSTEAFWQRNFVPVEVTVEAKDNDPIVGPNWGKSAAILVMPPDVGEAEALRYEALVRVRNALTDLLAERLVDDPPKGKQSSEHLRKERESQERVMKTIEEALVDTYGGLRFPRRAVSLTRGQLRRLSKSLASEQEKPSAKTHQELVEATESVLLAVDAAVLALGSKDSAKVAKRLADVAEEAAEAAATMAGKRRGDAASGQTRLDASVAVLGGSAKQLLRLGALGADLGEIVQNGLRRIDRSRKAQNLLHAELAARDLAARLRNPVPSSMGGSGSRLGDGEVGSGSGSGGGQGMGDSSDADDAAESGAQALDKLIAEHSSAQSDVERALEKAFAQDELDAFKDEAKKHAEAIRDAARQLPRRPGDPGSAEAAGKRARDLAESMADALEQGRPADAVQTAKEALKALDEARRTGQAADEWNLREQSVGRAADNAHKRVTDELAWAEEALEKLRRSAANRAKDDLGQSGKREGQLADKTGKLAKDGESGEGSLPDETLELLERAERAMKEAAKALERGDGITGAEQQQNAQRLLEMARSERDDEEESSNSSRPKDRPGDSKEMAKKADVPGKDSHKGPDAFRKRVLEGLGGSSDPLLKEAIKRYTEGLLR